MRRTDIAEQPTPQDPEEHSPSTARSGMQARAGRVVEAVRARHEELLERTSWAEIATAVGRRHVEANGSMLSGLLAYRLFLLVLPLGAIIVALAGFDTAASQDTSNHLRLGEAIGKTIAQAGQDAQRSRFPLLITGLFAFAIAAWGLLGALQYTAAVAWKIPSRRFPGKGRAFVRLAGSLLLFGLVIYISLVVRRAGIFAGLAGSAANTLAVFVACFGLGWILPRRCKEWFWLLPGAAFSSIGFLGLQAFAAFYLPGRLADASATYGALGITLSVLTYLFLVGVLLWAMLLVNSVVWEQRQDDPPGLLRRIADRVPLPTTTFGSGYVGEDEVAETVGGPLRSFSNAASASKE